MENSEICKNIILILTLCLFDQINATICPKPRTIKIGVLAQHGNPPDRLGAFNLARLMAMRENSSEIPTELLDSQPIFQCMSKMSVEVEVKKVNRSETLPQIAQWITKEHYDGIFQFIGDACDYEAATAGALNVAFLASVSICFPLL